MTIYTNVSMHTTTEDSPLSIDKVIERTNVIFNMLTPPTIHSHLCEMLTMLQKDNVKQHGMPEEIKLKLDSLVSTPKSKLDREIWHCLIWSEDLPIAGLWKFKNQISPIILKALINELGFDPFTSFK